MLLSDLTPAEYSDYDAYYIDLAPAGELLASLETSRKQVVEFFLSIPTNKHAYAYAKGKWTVKQVLQHLIDVERIFAYRMLRYARADTQSLPGFDVEDYGAAAGAGTSSLVSMVEEYSTARRSTIQMLQGFPPEALLRTGTASGLTASARALAFKLVGHDVHHCLVVAERYL
ncbi:MAG: DinB family protein [Bacteroidota bacterium]